MGTLPSKAEVVIIGGGIVGASIAYYLSKKGVHDVLLLERSLLGVGTTAKCVGGIRTQFSTKINIEFSLLSRKIFDHFEEEFGIDPEFHPVGYLFLAVRDTQWEILQANARLMRTFDLKAALLNPGEIRQRWKKTGMPVPMRSCMGSRQRPNNWGQTSERELKLLESIQKIEGSRLWRLPRGKAFSHRWWSTLPDLMPRALPIWLG